MDAIVEIKELIYSGQHKSFTDKELSLDDFTKAKEIAEKENLGKEIPLIDSFIRIYIDKDFEKAETLLDEYKETQNIQLLSYCYFLVGKIFFKKGDYNLAMDYYQKALDTPGYDTPGDVLNNMGTAYVKKGDYDRAIEYFQKAFDTPGYDTPGVALNNMGTAYGNKDDHDRAIEYFQKTLDTPGYDTPGDVLNNMGAAYHNKGDYDRAIEYFQKAFDTPGYDTPGNALNNMGNAYHKKGDYDLAIDYYQKALKEFEDLGENERVKHFTIILNNLEIEKKIGRERFEASSISDFSEKLIKEDL